MSQVNDNLVLIVGKSATGKSVSLQGLKDPEGVMYLNCEAGKKLPFRAKFKQYIITDPMQVLEAIDHAETMKDVHTIVIDTLTYLMEMYESNYVLNSSNGMKAWGDYFQFFKTLMQDKVAKSSKNIVFLAHAADQYNESEMVTEVKVPVKGSLKNNGVESYFSMVISTKKVPLKVLANYKNKYLTITPQEEALGYKHCFQTNLTKETSAERLRSPMGMWEQQETYIDNNIAFVMERIKEYYVG